MLRSGRRSFHRRAALPPFQETPYFAQAVIRVMAERLRRNVLPAEQVKV
jgi:hypothetical protein